MKVDIYTKIILTVIAVCLAVIVLRDINIVSEAQAQAPSELSSGRVVSVKIVGIEKSRRSAWKAIPVEVKLPVEIKSDFTSPVSVRIAR